MSGGKVVQVSQAVEAGGAVEAAPYAFGGAFFQQERAVFVVPYQPVERQGFDFCQLYSKACNLGNGLGCSDLGVLYEQGEVIE